MNRDIYMAPSFVVPPDLFCEGDRIIHPVTCPHCGRIMMEEWPDDAVSRDYAWENPEWLCHACERTVLDAGLLPLYEEACGNGNGNEINRLCSIAALNMDARIIICSLYGGEITAADILCC